MEAIGSRKLEGTSWLNNEGGRGGLYQWLTQKGVSPIRPSLMSRLTCESWFVWLELDSSINSLNNLSMVDLTYPWTRAHNVVMAYNKMYWLRTCFAEMLSLCVTLHPSAGVHDNPSPICCDCQWVCLMQGPTVTKSLLIKSICLARQWPNQLSCQRRSAPYVVSSYGLMIGWTAWINICALSLSHHSQQNGSDGILHDHTSCMLQWAYF